MAEFVAALLADAIDGVAHNGISGPSKFIGSIALFLAIGAAACQKLIEGTRGLNLFAILMGAALVVFGLALILPRAVPVEQLEEAYGFNLEVLEGAEYRKGEIVPTDATYDGERIWLGMDRSTGKSVWTLYVRHGLRFDPLPMANQALEVNES